MHYNFVRQHKRLANPYPRCPAMAMGIADHIWTCQEIAALLGGGKPISTRRRIVVVSGE